MKTNNFQLELMKPSQQNKEVFFNETIGIIDSFIMNSVMDFVDKEPDGEFKNLKFIITEGEYKNHICFSPFSSRGWSYMPPSIGMVYFCIALRSFVFFDGEAWQIYRPDTSAASGSISIDTGTSISKISERRFVSAAGAISIRTKCNFLYIQDNIILNIDASSEDVFDIVIKQNHEKIYELNFDIPILWAANIPYRVSQGHNLMDHIRLVKLPETDHYLGAVIQCGYKY